MRNETREVGTTIISVSTHFNSLFCVLAVRVSSVINFFALSVKLRENCLMSSFSSHSWIVCSASSSRMNACMLDSSPPPNLDGRMPKNFSKESVSLVP